MDLDGFLSAYAQAGAALVAIVAGFALQKLLSLEADETSIRRTIKRRRAASEAFLARCESLSWGWVDQQQFNRSEHRIIEWWKQNPNATIEQAYTANAGRVSLFSPPDWIKTKLSEARATAQQQGDMIFALPAIHMAMPAEHWARVDAEEDKMEEAYAQAIELSSENLSAIDDVEDFRAGSRGLGLTFGFLLVAFVATVVLPLSLLPWTGDLSLALTRVVSYYTTTRGLFVLVITGLFVPAFIYVLRRVKDLAIADDDVNPVHEFAAVTSFTNRFAYYEENYAALP